MASNLSGLSIVIPTLAHQEGILLLIKNVMLKDEPIEKSMKLNWEDVREGWEETVKDCITNGHSHVTLNQNNEVIGARLGRILDTKIIPHNFGLYDWMDGPTENSRLFASAFNELTSDWYNILIKTNGNRSEKILQFMTLCVRPDYGQEELRWR